MRMPDQTTIAVTAIIGVAVSAAWAASDLGIQDLPIGRAADGTTMSVTVVLPTADGIAIGADVRDGQKVVGRVSDMQLAASGASVELNVQADSGLPANAVASVELPSALGNPFVRLAAPAQPAPAVLRDGDVIPPDRTALGPQLETALATFGALMTRSGVDQLSTIVAELDTAFGGRSERIRGLLDSMSTLAAKTSEHQGEFDEALRLAADGSARFGREQRTVDGYLDALPRVVALLDVQRAKLDALFASTTALAATANDVLSHADMAALVNDASVVVQSLNGYNDGLRDTLSTMATFLDRFGASVRGDYLVFDGALDIPGTIDKLLTGGLLVNGTPITGRQALDGFLAGGLP